MSRAQGRSALVYGMIRIVSTAPVPSQATYLMEEQDFEVLLRHALSGAALHIQYVWYPLALVLLEYNLVL